jgi:hypothetical protein
MFVCTIFLHLKNRKRQSSGLRDRSIDSIVPCNYNSVGVQVGGNTRDCTSDGTVIAVGIYR